MCSVEKVFLEISQNSQSIFLNKVAGLHKIKKETLAEVFSCEFCEISKNTFFTRTHGRLLLDFNTRVFRWNLKNS